MAELQTALPLFEKYTFPFLISAIVLIISIQLVKTLIKQMEKRSEIRTEQEKERGELELKNRRMEIERREQEQKLLYEVQTEQLTQMKNMSDTLEKIQAQMYEYMNNINGDISGLSSNISGLSSNINLMWNKYDAIKEKSYTTDKSVSEIKDTLDKMSKDLHILLKNVEELSRNAGKAESV